MPKLSLPLREEEPVSDNCLCSNCPKRFKNAQGLSLQIKCTHWDNTGTKSYQFNKLLVF